MRSMFCRRMLKRHFISERDRYTSARFGEFTDQQFRNVHHNFRILRKPRQHIGKCEKIDVVFKFSEPQHVRLSRPPCKPPLRSSPLESLRVSVAMEQIDMSPPLTISHLGTKKSQTGGSDRKNQQAFSADGLKASRS